MEEFCDDHVKGVRSLGSAMRCARSGLGTYPSLEAEKEETIADFHLCRSAGRG